MNPCLQFVSLRNLLFSCILCPSVLQLESPHPSVSPCRSWYRVVIYEETSLTVVCLSFSPRGATFPSCQRRAGAC